MPAYLVYVLIVLAVGAVAGFGFTLGGGVASLFTAIGLAVVIRVLWEPLIKPLMEKSVRK